MAIWTGFNTDPAQNNANPPFGAPEGRVSFDKLSDIFRVVMAAIREVGNLASTTAGAIGTLGTQNANAINVTGGQISNVLINLCGITNSDINATNSINAGSLKVGVAPSSAIPWQTLYNAMFPVGTLKIYTMPSGLDLYWGSLGNGTWQNLPNVGDRLVVTAGTSTAVAGLVGNISPFADANTIAAGAHTPSGSANLTALNDTHLPNHHFATGTQLATGVLLGGPGGKSDQFNTAGVDGGGAGHGHSLTMNAVGDHTHIVQKDPQRYGVLIAQRVA